MCIRPPSPRALHMKHHPLSQRAPRPFMPLIQPSCPARPAPVPMRPFIQPSCPPCPAPVQTRPLIQPACPPMPCPCADVLHDLIPTHIASALLNPDEAEKDPLAVST